MKILALDIGGTAIKSAIVDDDNQILDARLTPSAQDLGERVQRAVAVAQGYADFDVLSVATTGQVDEHTQSILFQYHQKNATDDGGYPMGERLACAVGRPTFVLNDCNAAALGEAHFGAGRDRKSFLCLTFGTGVGGAIIEDGRLYTGARGIAAEVGHMVTHAGGRPCGCGRRGCYEQYASTTALLSKGRRRYPHLENAKQLMELAPTDATLRRAIGEWQREIVEGLATLTYVFNPACIVLGGGIMEQATVVDGVRCRFARRVIPTFSRVELLPAELGNRAGLYGAAVYAKQRLTSETE